MSVPKEPSSWKEAIQQLEYSKKHLPWDSTQVKPVERVSLYERKRQDREVDPVTLKFRDENRQKMADAKRAEVMNMRLTTTTNQLNSTFNIVSHIGPPRSADLRPRTTKTSNRDFNFVTNMKNEDHVNAPLLYDENYTIQKVKEAKPARASTSQVKIRDFNMISNDYYENNLDRKAMEFRQLKEALTKKYWETHNYDAIKGKYYDDKKEEQFINQRETLSEVKGTATILKLPPSVQYSDGNSFDILNHSVHDAQRLRATRVMEDRQLNRIKGMTLDPKMRDWGIADYDRKQDMKLHRISYKRWEQQRERGFDMVSNKVSLDSAPKPVPPKPLGMWDRITMNLPSPSEHRANQELQDLKNELIPPPSNRIKNLSGSNANRAGLSTAPAPLGSQFGGGIQNSSSPHLVPNKDSARSGYDSYRSNEDNKPKYFNNQQRTNTSGTSRPVPSLDLAKTDFAQPVTYSEPAFGGKGLAIPIIRTIVTGSRE